MVWKPYRTLREPSNGTAAVLEKAAESLILRMQITHLSVGRLTPIEDVLRRCMKKAYSCELHCRPSLGKSLNPPNTDGPDLLRQRSQPRVAHLLRQKARQATMLSLNLTC
jgi:hypothetical protein